MKQRILEIDMIRGFTVLLVFGANLQIFSGVTSPDNAIDYLVTWFIHVFTDGTVYTIFSFLFGLGLTLQKNSDWTRRMLALIGIGLIHGVLVNQGDILAIYGIYGLILYRVRNWSKKGLILAAIALLAIPAAYNLSVWLAGLPQTKGAIPYDVRFSQGFTNIFQARVEQWLSLYFPGQIFAFPNIFAAMMLGLAAGKQGFGAWPLVWFHRAGIIGIPCMVVYGTIKTFGSDGAIIAYGNGLATIGAPCLAAFYISLIVQLSRRCDMSVFAAAGQMSLTLYVQSGLIASLLVYGGLYGLLPVWVQGALVIVVYGLQLEFARFWAKRYRQGILEAFWRNLAKKEMGA